MSDDINLDNGKNNNQTPLDSHKQAAISFLQNGVVDSEYDGFMRCSICDKRLGFQKWRNGHFTYTSQFWHYIEEHNYWSKELDKILDHLGLLQDKVEVDFFAEMNSENKVGFAKPISTPTIPSDLFFLESEARYEIISLLKEYKNELIRQESLGVSFQAKLAFGKKIGQIISKIKFLEEK